jgi:hypothetical protein
MNRDFRLVYDDATKSPEITCHRDHRNASAQCKCIYWPRRHTGGDIPRRSAKGRFNISVAHRPVSTWNRRANSLPLVDVTLFMCDRAIVTDFARAAV